MADNNESCSLPHNVTTSETFTPLAYIIYKNLKYIVVMMTRRGTIAPLSHHSTCATERLSSLALIVDTSRCGADSEVWNAWKQAMHDMARSNNPIRTQKLFVQLPENSESTW